MFALPMRPPSLYIDCQTNELGGSVVADVKQQPPTLSISTNSQSTASTMSALTLSPMGTASPGARRPKLSLQTASLPLSFARKSNTGLSLTVATDSPTVRNTYTNAFNQPPVPSLSLSRPPARVPSLVLVPEAPPSRSNSLSDASSSASSDTPTIPYSLPMTCCSILRNSPLPIRAISTISTRAPRRMFPPVKRVSFNDKLVELMPTPVLEDFEPESEEETKFLSSPTKRRRKENIGKLEAAAEAEEARRHINAAADADEVPPTPVTNRRKRRREWVWTLGPLDGVPKTPDAEETVSLPDALRSGDGLETKSPLVITPVTPDDYSKMVFSPQPETPEEYFTPKDYL
ncbi:MAG: hypothetical protein MMC33_008703 [Icmadophila ericetorum]|nr:hypothetical protein [Icmadophila ericetorum]